MKNLLAGLMLALCLMGCTSSKEESAASEQQRKQLAEAVKQPLDKARDAEKQVFEGAEQQKKQADEL